MKTALLFLSLSALTFHASALDAPSSPQSPPKLQPSKITAVATAADKRTLVIRYEVAGTAAEERITFAREVADFRYCRWMGDYGIAVVVRTVGDEATGVSFSDDGRNLRAPSGETGAAETAEYYYSTLYLSGTPKDRKPTRIPAPQVVEPVLGIGNTGGDSIVITAVQHRRGPIETVSGWLYIDNCPIPGSGLVLGPVTPFTVPAEQPQSK
jgi:hypothetical protein